jgi:cellulose synthase/poly-beta-1,6-N-acetylglucosamine synthase-like glycosyltransferase/glycosyltransferase involved in cell wall biosynthesis
MKHLDIIVPCHNVASRLPNLLAEIGRASSSAGWEYSVFLINTCSSDNLKDTVSWLSTYYPISYYNLPQVDGVSSAVSQSIGFTSSEYVLVINPEYSVSPELFVSLIDNLESFHVVVVPPKANSPAVLFHRNLWGHISPLWFTKNGFVAPLLHIASELGSPVSVLNDPRFTSGFSVTGLVGSFFQTLRMKLTSHQVYPVPPGEPNSDQGSGVIYRGRRFITHSSLPRQESALDTLWPWQKVFLFFLLVGVFSSFALFTHSFLVVLIGLVTAIYFLDAGFSFFLVLRSLHQFPEIGFPRPILDALDPVTLPVYTLLCPLYKEAEVLPDFLRSLERLDWPKNKLEVLLLLEKDDLVTQKAASDIKLPGYVRVVIVPPSQPRTKPKACNYGLSLAKGEYLVVYDAEDQPDPLQLKKAYLAFQQLPADIACLQAKLNYYNPHHNLLTRLFTAEYSLWFDVTLPGLQSLNTFIPLGGTSNHFRIAALRQLHGWDAFNVTEDCDLGSRLFARGFRTAIIDSTTFEEANSSLKGWVRQRSRWIKGYIQTFLVHNRNPVKLFREHGIHSLVFELVVGGKIAFSFLNPLLWLTTVCYFLFRPLIGSYIESLYSPVVFYPAVFCLVVGNFLFLFYYMVGCARRGQWDMLRYIFFTPWYWLIVSIAAFKAGLQLISRPHYWEKTVHGLHLKPAISVAPAPLSIRLPDLGAILPKPRLSFSGVLSVLKNISPVGFNLNIIREKTPAVDSFQRFNILIFNWRDIRHKWAGGAEAYIHEIAKRWVISGHKVTLLCANDGKNSPRDSIEGVRIIRRGNFLTVYFWGIWYALTAGHRGFDLIIDSENGIPFFTPLFTRLPVYLLVHHVHQQYFRRQLTFPLAQIGQFLESSAMPFVYKNTPVITVSESSRRDLIDILEIHPSRISVVNPGAEMVPSPGVSKTAHPSFVYLGRIRPYKNIDLAIKAFSQVVKTHPQAKLTIAGEGENLGALKRLAGRLNLAASVTFTGKISEFQKIKLLTESWVMLQPSSYEGWGITVIEANACGTPVIASDTAGLRDSVVDQSTGWLTPLGDIDALASNMRLVINYPQHLSFLSQNAGRWASNFTWQFSADKFMEVVRSALAQKSYSNFGYELLGVDDTSPRGFDF